jgi:hypothetical protein
VEVEWLPCASTKKLTKTKQLSSQNNKKRSCKMFEKDFVTVNIVLFLSRLSKSSRETMALLQHITMTCQQTHSRI